MTNGKRNLLKTVRCKTSRGRKTIHYWPAGKNSHRYHDIQRCKLWGGVGELYGTGGFVFGLLGCSWVVYNGLSTKKVEGERRYRLQFVFVGQDRDSL